MSGQFFSVVLSEVEEPALSEAQPSRMGSRGVAVRLFHRIPRLRFALLGMTR